MRKVYIEEMQGQAETQVIVDGKKTRYIAETFEQAIEELPNIEELNE